MPKVKRLCYNKDMKKRVRGGFTLIELALSLIFIAVLSLTVVLLIQNTSAAFRRGMVLNQLNSIGMDLVDDFRISIQNSSSDPVTRMCEIYYSYGSSDREACIEDNGASFVTFVKMGEVMERSEGRQGNLGTMPIFGGICTGTYTYVWNSGYFEDTEFSDRTVRYASPLEVRVGGSYSNTYKDFRLLKIYDNERSICASMVKAQNSSHYTKLDNYINTRIPNYVSVSSAMVSGNGDDIVDLLKKSESVDFVLYDLYVSPPAMSLSRQNLFYSASFILGTRRGGINIKTAGASCKPPSSNYSEIEYCAINKFNFAAMAGGRRR